MATGDETEKGTQKGRGQTIPWERSTRNSRKNRRRIPGQVGPSARPCACWQARLAAVARAWPCRWGELDLVVAKPGRLAAGGGSRGRRRCGAERLAVWGGPGSRKRARAWGRARALLAGGPSTAPTPKTLRSGVRPGPLATGRAEAVALVAAGFQCRERPGGTLEVLPARCHDLRGPTEPARRFGQHGLKRCAAAATHRGRPPTCRAGGESVLEVGPGRRAP